LPDDPPFAQLPQELLLLISHYCLQSLDWEALRRDATHRQLFAHQTMVNLWSQHMRDFCDNEDVDRHENELVEWWVSWCGDCLPRDDYLHHKLDCPLYNRQSDRPRLLKKRRKR
jgi:hypothetical protein